MDFHELPVVLVVKERIEVVIARLKV